MTASPITEQLQELYCKLYDAFGPQGWWPGETPFEVALGAILTQNTNWGNVSKVITGLKDEGILDPVALATMPEAELANRFRSAGYYNIKARRVKNFLDFFAGRFDNSMEKMAAEDWEPLREALLKLHGIGPETADSILLYALHKPTFVVDAYTFRVLSRHHLVTDPCSYEELRQFFMDRLPPEVPLYQEFHALLVRVGKDFCRPQPRCSGCPLENWSGVRV
jgi:endonuclease-3 related protein|uniref:Endonuclease III domain-containing protein n=1 Tax=Desulfobacca acetoxidans TaxID=60893 RepID=A0A7V6DR06_9BACT